VVFGAINTTWPSLFPVIALEDINASPAVLLSYVGPDSPVGTVTPRRVEKVPRRKVSIEDMILGDGLEIILWLA